MLVGSYERRKTVLGVDYLVLARKRVLRVPDFILQCCVYLYRSVEDAENGRKAGGSGFLVGVPSAVYPTTAVYIYAVTNRHVIEGGASVIRLNTVDGGIECLDHKPTDWISHDSQDLAAILIPLSLKHTHTSGFLMPNLLLSRSTMKSLEVGPGDDTFLVGRFIYADGGLRNQPSVRFGRIAMNPGEAIVQGDGHLQESFLVESHSIGGYSGSPVFVFFHPLGIRASNDMTNMRKVQPDMTKGEFPIHLLGVDWGHLPAKWIPITDRDGNENPDGWGVRQNSGMMGVVPAWHVQELLDMDEFADRREQDDAVLKSQQEGAGIMDSESAPTFTRADFEAALKKVSRRVDPKKAG